MTCYALMARFALIFSLVLSLPVIAEPVDIEGARQKIAEMSDEISRLKDASQVSDDELMLERQQQKRRHLTEIQNTIGLLVAQMEEDNSLNETIGVEVRTIVADQSRRLIDLIASLRENIEVLREKRVDAPNAGSLAFEQGLKNYDDLLSTVLRMLYVNIQRGIRIGRDGIVDYAQLDKILDQRATLLAERMELVLERQAGAKSRLAQAPDGEKSAVQTELISLTERKNRLKTGLTATIALMRERGLDVSVYSQFLIQATGEISGDILDRRVLRGLAADWLTVVRERIVEQGPMWIFKTCVFAAIILVFWIISRVVKRIVRRMVSVSSIRFSSLLQNFFVRVSSSIVLLAGIFIALAQLGVQLGPVLAGLGVAGFILGFALQETLSNFAAGLMILIYRPFDIGDVVEAGGVMGKVNLMSLVSTTILTFDNQKLIVPNSKIWGNVIRNVNAESTRRVDLLFSISYADDIDATQKILQDLVAAHPAILSDPEPRICLHTLGESSVDFIVRPWVNSEDYWQVYWDLTKQVKQRFDAENITIPFPQREIHVNANAAPAT